MKFWKTAQDDYGEIASVASPAEGATKVLGGIEVQSKGDLASDVQQALEVVALVRKRIQAEAQEVEWNEDREKGGVC